VWWLSWVLKGWHGCVQPSLLIRLWQLLLAMLALVLPLLLVLQMPVLQLLLQASQQKGGWQWIVLEYVLSLPVRSIGASVPAP
jgi:hypothetical protein